MKKSLSLLLTGVFFLVLGLSTAAASGTGKDVAVLYDGQTETNRETINFLKRNFSGDSHGWVLHNIANAGDIKAGQYRAVIVLNTGLTSGIDPKFTDFIKNYPVKKDIILVTLVKGSKEMVITHTPADPGKYGVDTITAASVWSRSATGTQSSPYANSIEMHVAWVQQVLQILTTL